MKGYYDAHGNRIPGVTILESCLSDPAKGIKLIKVLEHFQMRIAPEAELKNLKVDWIIPLSW